MSKNHPKHIRRHYLRSTTKQLALRAQHAEELTAKIEEVNAKHLERAKWNQATITALHRKLNKQLPQWAWLRRLVWGRTFADLMNQITSAEKGQITRRSAL